MGNNQHWHRCGARVGVTTLCWLALAPGCLLPEVWETEAPTDATEVAAPTSQVAADVSAAAGEAAVSSEPPSAGVGAADPSQVGNVQAGAPSVADGSLAADAGAMASMPMTNNPQGSAGSMSSSPASRAAAGAAASGGAAGRGAASSRTVADPGSCGPENTNPTAMLDQMGPWTPTHIEKTGPSGASWIFYPAELGKSGMKHPVFNWDPGAGLGPDGYVDHLNLIASQGFVAISQASTSSGKDALSWLLAENDKAGSMWYQKLDTTRVGRGGHSMGALQSLSEASDPRLTLYVLVCGGSNGGSGAADIHAPSIFLGGEGESGTANFEGDFAAIKTAPSYFVTKTDTDHIYCARNNLAPWIAFMRMTWCGEQKYQKELLEGGAFCKAPWLACKTKNL